MSKRIARTLSRRLDELAQAAERSGAAAPAVARLLEAASVATMHAVALDLLTAARVPIAPPREVEAPETPAPEELREAA